ncbi:MAG: HNH endonuclease [Planctomycetes bacterium]|nr:HNH endonuclease [Planctomycetota bacterium]MBL7036996.1 HNH endonuclease [Pirellulaceae bacterium]
MIFQYPQHSHTRRHGPRGYVNYKSYKPWLRDEFDFRCVYCLWRERWYAAGEAAFSVEHLQSQAVAPQLVCEYENLVYACCRCNSIKTDAAAVLDPCRDAFGHHLVVLTDGRIHGLTPEGHELIRICKLDQPLLIESRRRLIELLQTLQESDSPRAARLREQYLRFPRNLPVLARCSPPGGNAQPEGIATSYYERARRAELPAVY